MSKQSVRETQHRIRQMEDKRELRNSQQARRKRDNVIGAVALTAVLGVAGTLQATVFASNPSSQEYAAVQSELEEARLASASPAPSNATNVPAADTAKGKTFTGELVLNGKDIGIEVNGTEAPQAAAVLKSLADAGTFGGRSCHRLLASDSASLLQCGAEESTGQSDPDYTWGPLENTPDDGVYPEGTIAIARTSDNAYGNGQQFFIVYKDTTLPDDAAGGYTIVGKVTSGLDVVKDIAAKGVSGGSLQDGAPETAVKIDSMSLS